MSHSELEDFIFNQQNLFKELSGASPPGTPLGLCPGPTWGLKAAPDHCQKLAPPTSNPGSAPVFTFSF